MSDKHFFVYVMANKAFGTLYIGVTNDLSARAYQHRTGQGCTFTRKYKLSKLVYYEAFDDPLTAIQREKTMKRWRREWKLTAVNNFNPEWRDLFETLQH